MLRPLWLVLTVLSLLGGPAAANETPRALDWDDLVPKDAKYAEDPLSELTYSQLDDIAFILRVGNLAKRVELEDGELTTAVKERRAALLEQGIDVDKMIAQAREASEARRAADEKVKTSLDGQLVRMPGYVLPLEFSGSKVTEFLLVPFVGACIHVPPPPPNQIVHVSSRKGFDAAGLYTPVYVTGHLKATGIANKSMFLQDGNVNVSYGYSMQADDIEIFKEKNRP